MFLYPLWIRIWHFLNSILILLLILSGILMQYTGPDSRLLIAFYPGSVRLHEFCGIILTVSYMVFIAGNLISGNSKYYRIRKKDLFPGIGRQLKYFVRGMFRNEKKPYPVTMEDKFNPLAKITYFTIMYLLLPLLILSGIFMLVPDMTLIKTLGRGIYLFIDTIHVILAFTIFIFLIIHIYMCTTGTTPGSLFRAIISGYQESDE